VLIIHEECLSFSIQEEPLAATKVTVRSNGSIRIEGDFEIVDSEGGVFDLAGRTTIGLCRCGHSENKPFCDGSHKKVGFQSEIKARALPPPAPKPPTT
jgi:CDGSH-type Zn-finger protein